MLIYSHCCYYNNIKEEKDALIALFLRFKKAKIVYFSHLIKIDKIFAKIV